MGRTTSTLTLREQDDWIVTNAPRQEGSGQHENGTDVLEGQRPQECTSKT